MALIIAQKRVGNKTAALFVKACCNIHWDDANNGIIFWKDFPDKKVVNKIYLPVDRVIVHIFSRLKIDSIAKGDQFEKINIYLQEHYKNPKEMLVWDDLWFWGFITQKSIKNDCLLEWNFAKYYAVFHAPKDEKSISKIKTLAEEFIKIIEADKILIESQQLATRKSQDIF